MGGFAGGDMDRKLKWRTFWLALLTVLAICVLVPSIVDSRSLPIAFSQIFNKRISLGLDLQGGLHIVYSIDLDKAVDDKATEIKRDFEARLEEMDVQARVSTPRTPLGAVVVQVDDPAALARIDESFVTDYDETLVPLDCPSGVTSGKCWRVSSEYAEGIRKAALQQAVLTIRDRIDAKGVAEPTVIEKGDQIIVELPGLDPEETTRVRDLIARTAKLEFKIVDDGSPFMQSVYRRVEKGDALAQQLGITADVDLWSHDTQGQFQDYYLKASGQTRSVTPEEAAELGCHDRSAAQIGGKVECFVSGRQVLDEYIAALAAEDPPLAPDDDHQLAFQEINPGTGAEGDNDAYWRSYYLLRAVELSGSSVQDAYVYWNSTTNRPEVLINFNRYGGRRFGDLTAKNVGKKMAIILDETINSAPQIQSAIRGGSSSISMGASDNLVAQAEAQDLVAVLKTGSLPAPLQEESVSEVGPLLGRDAVRKARTAFLLGSLLVVLIMIYIYRTSGVISIVALGLNLLFMMATLSWFGATLTLPGIAALVLTVGMAVDANIIIYERIREELRTGKSVRGAVDAGFSRGFAAILDGQLTTAAAGYVLMQYGSGPIRGFAVMLLIGIGSTLFTATWCTRLFFEYYIGRKKNVVLGI